MVAASNEKKFQKYEGMTLKEIARERKKSPEECLIDLLNGSDFEMSAFYFSQSEEVIREVIAKPYVMVGSDSIADGSRRPHPRAYGTVPKIFREYVREKKAISLGEAVRKLTSAAADHFHLPQRGEIKEGSFADIVLFDAGEMNDEADYENATALGQGVKWVFVNGQPAVKNGKPTLHKNGRVLGLS